MRINRFEYMGETCFSIGGCQLTETELWELYNKKYLVNSRGVYQIFYSAAQKGFYGLKVINQKGLTKRGRFFKMTGTEINLLLGKEILNDF